MNLSICTIKRYINENNYQNATKEVKMAKKHTSGNVIGSWAFLIGVIIAFVLGLLGEVNNTVTIILIVLGLIIGLFNIADEETGPFLMSGAVLVIVGALGSSIVGKISFVGSILQALTILFVPATIIVALKNVFVLAKN